MAKNSRSPLQSGRASTAAILGYTWDADIFRTDDAMKATGLTRSTTINALDELISLGLIRELSNTRADNSYRFGRPSRRFEFRANAGILLGIDAGRSSTTITVADLVGRQLLVSNIGWSLPTSSHKDGASPCSIPSPKSSMQRHFPSTTSSPSPSECPPRLIPSDTHRPTRMASGRI